MSALRTRDAVVREGLRLQVRGIVQGVGFRPFVYGLATDLGLDGWVRNTSDGVEIEVSGLAGNLEDFRQRIEHQAPPLARIQRITTEACPAGAQSGFRILASRADPSGFQPVSPDVATCDACLRELFDPADRRYRYPFINCTHCGPRLTIIEAMPYDRATTTMAEFPMCDACAAEYRDPTNRRFHAEPIACPACGPSIWIEAGGRTIESREAALQEARRRLSDGEIVAVKGLGGFHLACNALDDAAVDRLRRRKGRGEKPLAVMFPDLAAVAMFSRPTEIEKRHLTNGVRPIVILQRSSGSALAEGISPGQMTVGAMLPYTPLHHLLLERGPGFPHALVMTSGNRSEEPIAIHDDAARRDLGEIADAFLFHDRRIHQRCDDSVLRVYGGADYPMRRARGFVPEPVRLISAREPILAVGAEQKNTFCLTRDGVAFLGPHIGDLDNDATLDAFGKAVDHFQSLFRISPTILACDLHPDYLATRYAERRAEAEGLRLVRIQHHHAHIAACLAEAGAPPDRPAIGMAFDGTGYGWDATVWGGEILLADQRAARRIGHLTCVPLPGGAAAIRQPWRMGLAWLHKAGIDWEDDLACVAHATPEARKVVARHLEEDALAAGLIAPLTSSVGRLFDAVAALIGVRQEVHDEGQAAIELEAIADPGEAGAYEFERGPVEFDATPVIRAIVRDLRAGVARSVIAARFHNGLAALVCAAAVAARDLTGVREVALSGGVWQNLLLLRQSVEALEAESFDVLVHRRVPPNDGGLALGQAAVAAADVAGRR